MTAFPTSYADAREIYEDRRKRGTLKRGVRLANNTYLSWQDEIKPTTSSGLTPSPSWFGVKLHRTNVVTFHSDGSVVLDSGGWKTATTKDRMNCALPPGWSVYSTRGVWYLSHRGAKGGTVSLSCQGGEPADYPGHRIGKVTRWREHYSRVTREWEYPHGWVATTYTAPQLVQTYDDPYTVPEAKAHRWTVSQDEITDCPKCGKPASYVSSPVKSYPYADGMYIDTRSETAHGEGEDPRAQARLRKRAGEYAKAYVAALYAGEIPAPSNGDCFGCLFVPVEKGASPHAGMAGPDHMLSHLEEKYYVPSLVIQALDRFGGSMAAKHDLACLFNPGQAPKQDDGSLQLFGMQDQILRMVRRHVCEQLGLGA